MKTVTVGNFDGIHRGHLQVVSRAGEGAGETVPVCFEPVTRQYFSGNGWHRRLTTAWERYRLFKDLGMERLVVVPFHPETVEQEPDEFLRCLHRREGFDRIVVGYDFHFGRNRSGTVEYLSRWCTSRGIDTIIVPPLEIRGEPVKSERIRRLLERGEMENAEELLGRPYSLTGAVARGKGLGRKLGYPTLNLRVPGCKLLPRSGSYRGLVHSGDEQEPMPAAVFVPETVTGPVEACIPDRRLKDSYGSLARVELQSRIRSKADPVTAGELKELIAGDIEVVRRAKESRKGRMEDPER
ncbi:MAG: riboflavin kinase [Candidatus Aegiribacteria sp.]